MQVSVKLANLISATNSIHKSYASVDLAQVRAADGQNRGTSAHPKEQDGTKSLNSPQNSDFAVRRKAVSA